jgi:hypothetical protein
MVIFKTLSSVSFDIIGGLDWAFGGCLDAICLGYVANVFVWIWTTSIIINLTNFKVDYFWIVLKLRKPARILFSSALYCYLETEFELFLLTS